MKRDNVILTRKHGIDQLESLIDLLSYFRSSKDDLAADEDEKYNLRFHHAVDQAREQLGLVAREVMMLGRKSFKADRELDIARTNNCCVKSVTSSCALQWMTLLFWILKSVNFALNPNF